MISYFLYILFLPDIGYDFNWEEKKKEYLPPLYSLCFLISMIVQVVGYFWFQVLFICEYYFFFDKVMGRLGTAYIYSLVFISSSNKHLP